ncbi:MAG: hypothetical protein M0O96_02165 [Desulforhopalus sp.]|nr:hypothetical protein [Desulforhopalus sp.]
MKLLDEKGKLVVEGVLALSSRMQRLPNKSPSSLLRNRMQQEFILPAKEGGFFQSGWMLCSQQRDVWGDNHLAAAASPRENFMTKQASL